MVAYKKQVQQSIQILRQRNGGNPRPTVLRRIEAHERRIKEKRTRQRKAKQSRKRMQERAKEAEANSNTAKDSPSMDGPLDASGDASENNGYDDIWEGFDSPVSGTMDRDKEPEQLRLTTPEKLRLTTPEKLRLTTSYPTNPPPDGNETRGHEGGNGDSSCGVGKCAGGGLRGDMDIWTGGC